MIVFENLIRNLHSSVGTFLVGENTLFQPSWAVWPFFSDVCPFCEFVINCKKGRDILHWQGSSIVCTV